MCGLLLRGGSSLPELALIVWINFSGVYLVYRLNDFIDSQPGFAFSLRSFLAEKNHTLMSLQFLLLCIPAAILILPGFSVIILAGSAFFGLIYSFSFKIGSRTIRLKNIFLLKNLLIGMVWGSLVLIGYGFFPGPEVFLFFVFCSLQVVIGSMIRDIPDVENDLEEGVNSLPGILGITTTIVTMHFLNLASLVCAFFSQAPETTLLLFGTVVLWRAINLYFVQKHNDSTTWTQHFNLFTCVLISLVQLILVLYGHFFA